MNKETAVFRSLEIIENRIAEKLSVENISDSVYFSKYHYQRLFREIVGDSVMDYVMKRKLTLAGRELLETDATVLDIALKFGYDSHEGFTRSFKAYMGITPKEYRKYNLASISQNKINKIVIAKERLNMNYSKNTNEIIREFNDFIVKAKETAKNARKIAIPEYPAYARFWNTVADITDELTDNVKTVLERVTGAGEGADEITNLFQIMKMIDHNAFRMNMVACSASIHIARGTPPEHSESQQSLCRKYREFAFFTAKKSVTVYELLKELSALIFDDMRKTASEKIQAFDSQCKAVIKKITGYNYLKEELAAFSNKISSMSCKEITVKNLEDWLLQLEGLSFAVLLDVSLRGSGTNKTLYDDLIMLKNNFSETVDFFKTLAKLESDSKSLTPPPTLAHGHLMIREDIVFMGNILLFYAKAEVADEKLGKFLSDEQKDAFNSIFNKMSEGLQFTSKSTEVSAYKKVAGIFQEIYESMERESNKIELNGSLLVITQEFKSFAEKLRALAEDVEAQKN